MLEDMNKIKVTVVDYGIGNLLSVRRGLEYCGADVKVTSDLFEISNAERVVLPGVGAFKNGMELLSRSGIIDAIFEVAAKQVPVLGICLGMQLLFSESEEFGFTQGLGLIQGKVAQIPPIGIGMAPLKLPFIGWSELQPSENRTNWSKTILKQNSVGDEMYFIHSYMATPVNQSDRVADCLYGGIRIPAVVSHQNIIGCQFHPEKSGKNGLKVLEQFLLL